MLGSNKLAAPKIKKREAYRFELTDEGRLQAFSYNFLSDEGPWSLADVTSVCIHRSSSEIRKRRLRFRPLPGIPWEQGVPVILVLSRLIADK
jgi:hypothetical protein